MVNLWLIHPRPCLWNFCNYLNLQDGKMMDPNRNIRFGRKFQIYIWIELSTDLVVNKDLLLQKIRLRWNNRWCGKQRIHWFFIWIVRAAVNSLIFYIICNKIVSNAFIFTTKFDSFSLRAFMGFSNRYDNRSITTVRHNE